MDQRLSDELGEGVISGLVVDWKAITSLPTDLERDVEPNNLDPEGTLGDLSEMDPIE